MFSKRYIDNVVILVGHATTSFLFIAWPSLSQLSSSRRQHHWCVEGSAEQVLQYTSSTWHSQYSSFNFLNTAFFVGIYLENIIYYLF